MSIQVSERAVAEIKKASAKRATAPKGLRVGIRGGGCTGFSYFFEWSDSEPRPEDKVLAYEEGTVKVFVDPKSLKFLDGTELDYDTSLVSKGFIFNNPHAKSSCGCGASFSI